MQKWNDIHWKRYKCEDDDDDECCCRFFWRYECVSVTIGACFPFRTYNLDNLATLTVQYIAILFLSHMDISQIAFAVTNEQMNKQTTMQRSTNEPHPRSIIQRVEIRFDLFLYICWLMVLSSLLASPMLSDSLRVGNLIWCAVAFYIIVFFFVSPCTQILLTMFKKKNVSTVFSHDCEFQSKYLHSMSNNTRSMLTHLCHFYFLFVVCDSDFARVTYCVKVCVYKMKE